MNPTVGHLVKLKTWKAPKGSTAVVVRTYKAPDDDSILALPSSHPLYFRVCEAVRNDTLSNLPIQEVYAGCKRFYRGEFR